jgi:hypothetical protein
MTDCNILQRSRGACCTATATSASVKLLERRSDAQMRCPLLDRHQASLAHDNLMAFSAVVFVD